MTSHGHWSSGFRSPNSRFNGTVRPWSTSIRLTTVMSNSFRISDCAIWQAKSELPFTTGTGRRPQPSSADRNSSAQPMAKVGKIVASNAEA